ncbi:MAG: hypothetical protein Q9181_003101 [Wetmoreana brouardii]
MAEEVRNASKTIPRIMLATMIFNGALGFVMLVTLCFCVGNLEEVLKTETGYPFIQIFYNATPQGATTMVSIIVVCNLFAGVTAMATASRQLFSFARDRGVRAGWDIPLNAVLTTALFSILLISISFGSSIAFNQLTALSTIALDPTPQSMNWSIVIFMGVLAFSGVYYLFRARHKYEGPVKLVKKME